MMPDGSGPSAYQPGFASLNHLSQAAAFRPPVFHKSKFDLPTGRRKIYLSMVQSQDEEIESKIDSITKSIMSGSSIDLQDEVLSEAPLDDELSEALQPSINPDIVPTKPLRKSNKQRMQMFAFLSQPIVEVGVVGLVLFSCFLVAINTLEDLPSVLSHAIQMIDTLCVYIFAVEFFLRWWAAGQFQLRYLTKPLAAIDAVVVILPLILSGLLPLWDLGAMAGFYPAPSLPGWLVALSSTSNSALLNLRLLRILKFQRVLTDEKTYMKFEMALGMKKSDVRPYQLQLARVIISIFTLASVSTGLIYSAEHEVNPNMPDYFAALYFGLTTLTTVGFGDITPVTSQGRLVVILSILAGVAIIPAQAASLAEAYLEFQRDRAMGKKRPRKVGPDNLKQLQVCSNCGSGPHRSDAFFCWNCGESLGD
jgi:voltage-gated potassium channel